MVIFQIHIYFENPIFSAFTLLDVDAQWKLCVARACVRVCVFAHAHWGFPRLTKTASPFIARPGAHAVTGYLDEGRPLLYFQLDLNPFHEVRNDHTVV